jgi:hypothetical protein
VTDNDLKIWNDAKLLTQWTLAELAYRDLQIYELEATQKWPEPTAAQTRLALATLQASNGNVAPLREMYPEIAQFINAPARKRPRGRRRRDPFTKYAIEIADNMAREIRRLWKQHFGKSNRAGNDELHLRIAADQIGIAVDDLKYFRREKTRRR